MPGRVQRPSVLCSASLLLLLLTTPSFAQGGDPAGSLASKLQIHGFLTQAYATANFLEGGVDGPPSGDERALGIPEEGTTDYRFMAIQFRYEMTPKDIMVVQLSSRALGISSVEQVEDEIEFDWGFYERRLTDNSSIKVGRVPIPLGIYNEIRDVGTILPFYRPPFGFYREGAFTSESIDGVLLSHQFNTDSDWSLSADLYGGEFDLVETFTTPMGEEVVSLARSRDSFGVQLWLNTPVSGLRLGLGGQRRNITGGLEGTFRDFGQRTPVDDYYFSVDATFDRFVARGEIRRSETFLQTPFARNDLDLRSSYLQFGWYATPKFQIWLQGDFSGANNTSPIFLRPDKRDFRDDYGIAFNYQFTANIVLKLEYHEVQEEQLQLVPVFTPAGPRLDPVIVEADNGNYTIVSLSTSF